MRDGDGGASTTPRARRGRSGGMRSPGGRNRRPHRSTTSSRPRPPRLLRLGQFLQVNLSDDARELHFRHLAIHLAGLGAQLAGEERDEGDVGGGDATGASDDEALLFRGDPG